MNKKGQLAWIELQFVFWGLLVGLAVSFAVMIMSAKKIIPFKIPMICGLYKFKKGQLAGIEFHYFMIGFTIGLVGPLVLTYLGTKGIIPFKIPFVC